MTSFRVSQFLLAAGLAAVPISAKDIPKETSDEDIVKAVKLPDGYEARVFARPPNGGYPTSVSAAIDGTIFVAIDENGSLGQDRNLKPGETANAKRRPGNPGRVVRMRDTDGDGKADEFKTFAEMESPRGVIWDGPDGTGPGTLYVMHPPNLTAYTDTDGDGVADKQEDILTGLGFGLDFRGADHTTNGCRLGIDGFIYIAVGDYGFINAKGKDGTTLTNRGGGIVRIRPDGTGLEMVSRGQRNIYDVAISPTLDLFTRDNTNDGGGWNVRLSFVPPGVHMGYPYYYKNFPDDMLPPLADYGGGSPCGALWLDEPGLPQGLFTVEWGSDAIMYHGLQQKGAGWQVVGDNQGQSEWIKIKRPTDMDVDGSGRIYITSWEGATFKYNGPNAGYVLRVEKKDLPKANAPNVRAAKGDVLSQLLVSPSAVLRLAAQREASRRTPAEQLKLKLEVPPGSSPAVLVSVLEMMKISMGPEAPAALNRFMGMDGAREYAITVAGSDARLSAKVPTAPLVAGLTDKNPRVRIAAVTALRRLGKTEAAPNMVPLVVDTDPVVAHITFRALRDLKAAQPCFAALDSSASNEALKAGVLRVLYGIYDPAVVGGLITRLPDAKGESRRGILDALCRLANQDAPYETPSVWWGTRPDTSGPIYQPIAWRETEKISAALKTALDAADEAEAKWLVTRMYATKVAFPGLVELMLAKAGNDTLAQLTAIEGLIRSDNSMPPAAISALQGITSDAHQPPVLRSRALSIFQKCLENKDVFPGTVAAFAPLAGHDLGDAKLTAAFENFTRDGKNGNWIEVYAKLLAGTDVAKRQLAAIILVNLSTDNVLGKQHRESAKKAVEAGFATPESSAALLTAIARTGAKSLAEKVKGNLNHPNKAVAEAALFAFQKLNLNDKAAPTKTIGEMKYEEVIAAVKKGGDARIGQEMYLRAGCIACHTVSPDESPKGPILGAVAKIYDRAALTESILKPNAKIAQGFESTTIKTKKGEQIEGFVTREGGDSVDVRNIAGQTVTVEKADIADRGHREQSMMPEGLLNSFTPTELADLLAWMESLKK